MSKRKPMDKTEARERRNQLLASAAAAELSLTEGVRDMRAIAGMTQEEFAQHRGVSARVIKAIELGQGNPTVATLNRIGQFFGLEVAFVPVRRTSVAGKHGRTTKNATDNAESDSAPPGEAIAALILEAEKTREDLGAKIRMLSETLGALDSKIDVIKGLNEKVQHLSKPAATPEKKRKLRSSGTS
jgi:transcriptional regulator with XRE-family HTH domain